MSKTFFKLNSTRAQSVMDNMREQGRLPSLEFHGDVIAADSGDVRVLRSELIRQASIDAFEIVESIAADSAKLVLDEATQIETMLAEAFYDPNSATKLQQLDYTSRMRVLWQWIKQDHIHFRDFLNLIPQMVKDQVSESVDESGSKKKITPDWSGYYGHLAWLTPGKDRAFNKLLDQSDKSLADNSEQTIKAVEKLHKIMSHASVAKKVQEDPGFAVAHKIMLAGLKKALQPMDLFSLSDRPKELPYYDKKGKIFNEELEQTIYPNTEAGVIQYLENESDDRWLRDFDFEACHIHQDPQVDGVWAVDDHEQGVRVIVYLAGYKEPMGNIRKLNDHEEGDLPASAYNTPRQKKMNLYKLTTDPKDLPGYADRAAIVKRARQKKK